MNELPAEIQRFILLFSVISCPFFLEGLNAVSQQINEVYYRGFTEKEIQQHETYLTRILANLQEYEALSRRKTR
jgi:hypothetical protein